MSIVWGITAALAWGVAFYFDRYSIRALGSGLSLISGTLLSIVWLTAYMLLSGELARLSGTPAYDDAWRMAIIATSFNAVANVVLFRAIEMGAISVVAPISSSYAAFVVLFSLLGGAALTPVQVVGIAVCIVGIIAILPRSGTPGVSRRALLVGALLATLGALLYGAGFYLLGRTVTPVLGSVAPVWVGRFTTLAASLYLVAQPHPGAREHLNLRDWRAWALVVAATALGNLAFIANNLGYATGEIAVVSVLSSLYAAVPVVMAWLLLGEKLAVWQRVGLGLILLGVALVSLQT